MSAVPKDYVLTPQDRADPIVWIVRTPIVETGHLVDVSNPVMERYFGAGTSRRLKSFRHDDNGAHFLMLRGGTGMHTDRAYHRYSHQLVLRNDGTGIIGWQQPKPEHYPMRPGVMYCLDTHSPHQGLRDPRLFPVTPTIKCVVAVDRDEPLEPDDALALLIPFLDEQLNGWEQKRPTRAKR